MNPDLILYLFAGGTRAKGVSKLGVFRNTTTAKVVVKKTDVSLEIETIKVHLTNLFNGDPLLGKEKVSFSLFVKGVD